MTNLGASTPARHALLLVLAIAAALVAPGTAAAIAPNTGVQGTLDLAWSNTTGAPITAWNGSTRVTFDPTVAARQSTLVATADPRLGVVTRPVYVPHLQSGTVSNLVSVKTEDVACPSADDPSIITTYSHTTQTTAITDPRVAFEITRPTVNLLTGTGSLHLDFYISPSKGGWIYADRNTLPGRHVTSDFFHCPGLEYPAADPAAPDALVFSMWGQGAVPRAVSDWMAGGVPRLAGEWPLRRQADGRWRVYLEARRHETFADTPFGAQDTQQLDFTATSDIRLVGSLRALEARCMLATGAIARARTAAAAVAIARRAGFTDAQFAGTKLSPVARRTSYIMTGRSIGNGTGNCGAERYRVWRIAPWHP